MVFLILLEQLQNISKRETAQWEKQASMVLMYEK